MEKQRKLKLLSIFALVLAVLATSLGFAAFSTTLSISSSASVSANSDNFKMRIYGYNGDPTNLWPSADNEGQLFLDSNYSLTEAVYSSNYDNIASTKAVIDNQTLSISNLKATFNSKPLEQGIYFFKIKNEGAYDAYITDNLTDVITGTCTAGTGTTASYVAEACKDITLIRSLVDNQYNEVEPIVRPNESVYLFILMQYDANNDSIQADGPFSVEFPTIQLTFTTTPTQ